MYVLERIYWDFFNGSLHVNFVLDIFQIIPTSDSLSKSPYCYFHQSNIISSSDFSFSFLSKEFSFNLKGSFLWTFPKRFDQKCLVLSQESLKLLQWNPRKSQIINLSPLIKKFISMYMVTFDLCSKKRENNYFADANSHDRNPNLEEKAYLLWVYKGHWQVFHSHSAGPQ